MISNSKHRYGLVSQSIHWLMALLIIVLLGLGTFMHDLPQTSTEEINQKFWFYSLHKTLGMLAFALAIGWVIWGLLQPKPVALPSHSNLERFASKVVHWLLYSMMIIMPLSGWLHHAALDGYAPIWWPFSQNLPFIPKSENLADTFGDIHDVSANLLIFSVLMHVAGAIKHVVLDHDDTLKRMLPGHEVEAIETEGQSGSKSNARLAPMALALSIVLVIVGTTLLFDDNETEGSISETRENPAAKPVSVQVAKQGDNRWAVQYEESKLSISLVQSGKTLEGGFGAWQADIDFDPDNLEASKISVEIDIMSLELGSASNQAKSKDFLDGEQFPGASFVSEQITQTVDNSYIATGDLTISGQSQKTELPFNLEIKDNQANANGELKLKRLDFGIGQKGFPNGNMVGLEVNVSFVVKASRASSSQ